MRFRLPLPRKCFAQGHLEAAIWVFSGLLCPDRVRFRVFAHENMRLKQFSCQKARSNRSIVSQPLSACLWSVAAPGNRRRHALGNLLFLRRRPLHLALGRVNQFGGLDHKGATREHARHGPPHLFEHRT